MRRRGGKQEESRLACHSLAHDEPPVEPRASADISTQEIGNNSLIGDFREVPDSGMIELFAGKSPSAGDDAISRALDTDSRFRHEQSIRQGSQVDSHTSAARSGHIYISTRISRNSRANNTSTFDTLGVENVIFASDRPEDPGPEVESIATSNLEDAIYSSYMRKSLDLNRSLPPTPISEGPQMSPTTAKPNPEASLREHPLREKTNGWDYSH